MRALPFLALLACSCAAARAHHATSMETVVQRLETTAPDREALERGDARTTYRTLGEMAGWISRLAQDPSMPPVDRTRLGDRVREARTRFRFAAAAITQPPDLGFALATEPIAYAERTDEEALTRPAYLAIVRQLADARVATRQTLVREARSYAIRGGKVGNCVAASRPFEAGRVNPGLTFRPRAGQLAYVRCYPRVALRELPRRDGRFFGGGSMISPPALALDHVDFTVRFSATRPSSRAVTLTYEYTRDNVVVWEDGAQRVRADRRTVVLASSPMLIDTGDDAITRR